MESWPPRGCPGQLGLTSFLFSHLRLSSSVPIPLPSWPRIWLFSVLLYFILFFESRRMGMYSGFLGWQGGRRPKRDLHAWRKLLLLSPQWPVPFKRKKNQTTPSSRVNLCQSLHSFWKLMKLKLCLSPSQSWITLSPFSLSLPLFNFFSMIAINGGGKGCPIPMTGDCHPTWSFGWRWGASMYSSISYKVPPPATGLWFFSSKLLITCSLSQSPPVVKFYFTIIYAMKYLQMKLCTLGFVSK